MNTIENINQCPICGGKESEYVHTCKDYVATGENFKIVKCKNCTHQFTNPRPSAENVGVYYQSKNYISHSGGEKNKFGLTYKLYDIIRNISIKSKLKIIKKYNNKGELLDLGCGLGYFLKGVKDDQVFNARGIDISEDAREYVKKAFGITVDSESELNNYMDESVDVITQWHVLEHVYELEKRMTDLKRILRTNGTLFIAVPNSNSYDAQYYKEYWDGYDVPRHIHHFNRESIGLLLNKHGFEIVEIKPMWFDAPYISMRSEYHRGNKTLGFVMGGMRGMYSNLQSIFTKNYSSILVIAKHNAK
jgi:2-polyprenyl-3-methyl-5-hydroxy-6-metoxy-1,4-benzoquinol methylase